MPVDDDGHFFKGDGQAPGMEVNEANPVISGLQRPWNAYSAEEITH